MSLMSPLQAKFHKLIRAAGIFDDRFYLSNNPDVRAIGMDALEHYLVAGEAEGRAPAMLFDPSWYASQKPRLPDGFNLLVHYLTAGDRDGFQPFPGFDPEHVRAQVPERREPALVAYLAARQFGAWLNPNRFFDCRFYLDQNPDVAAAGVDPYYHFVLVGADEGRLPSAEFSWFSLRERFHLSGPNSQVYRQLMARWRSIDWDTVQAEPSVQLLQTEVRANHRPSPLFEDRAAPPAAGTRRAVDLFAFYLTQFHRVAENDEWWGEGFTEWHNVVRGLPRFSGHYQPRIPSALGFYDLEDPRVLPRQVAMARDAGITGFAFYYYNFGAQRLLERPLDRFRADPTLDIGYFLIWANETWSRRWDGSESEILLEQTYPDGLIDELTDDLSRHFDDPRYKRIDGRPLFVIYRVGALPDPLGFVARLRAAFADRGQTPLMYMAQTFEDLDPRVFGLDGAMEFPPHKHSRTLPTIMPARIFGHDPALRIWDYEAFIAEAEREPPADFPLIRTCFPSWDNDSRRQGASAIVHGSTPDKFARWLGLLADAAEREQHGPGIVCVNAWNEWGEGAYLEPDRHFGHAYLNTVQRVMHPRGGGHYGRVVLVGHDGFAAGAQLLLLHIGETLAQRHGCEVAFVLLRGDPGFDAMLPRYQRVGAVHVVGPDGDMDTIAARLRAGGFGHAIVNSSASAPMLAPLAAMGIEAVLLVHELPHMFATLGMGEMIRDAARALRGVFAPSAAIAAMLGDAGVPAERVRVQPQGLYRPVALIERDGAGAVVGLGYADMRKGVDLFVDACAAFARAGRPRRFLWQGDWDPATRQALAPRVDPLIRAGLLTLLPHAPDIADTLAAGDVYFLSSREDPMPAAAIEAWGTGLPVVAFAGTGGVADLIAADPLLGTLADAQTGDAAADAIARVTAAPDTRQAARSAWVAETFDWGRYCDTLLATLYAAPAVDVAVIGHNHGRFARERLASILAQTLPPARIRYHDIASTDGSLDRVRDVAAAWGTRVSVVAEPPNDGRIYRSWLAIAQASDAPYLHFAEGDDVIAPTMLERCIAGLEAAPNAGFAFTAVRWIDEGGRTIADHAGYPASVLGIDLSDGGAGGAVVPAATILGSDMMVRNPVLSVSSVVWRRAALIEVLAGAVDRFDTLGFAYDWLAYLVAAQAGWDAVFVPEMLCLHRQHHASHAARDDLPRHADEIRRIYALMPVADAARQAARQAYLDSLAG